MKKIINRLSDKALSTLLREETAGACVPEHGQTCVLGSCGSNGWWYQCVTTYSCNGACSCTQTRTQNRC
ncbi:hypothetical protein ABIA31_004770 [Catenulispora sp. MAP5-51]|jgi:hypothetical protein|uniref:hypothetical protein n=1 Tax=Catenulispora sp. MAP5-51 TaxID=3156298 RepID=UPI0035116F3D